MILHCWKDKASQYDIGTDDWVEAFLDNGTCMLEIGHSGPCVFTHDDEVVVEFMRGES